MIKIYHEVQELFAFSLTDHEWPYLCSAKPRHHFTYQYQANVKIYYFAKFDLTISMLFKIFVNIFAKRPRLPKMMLSQASSSYYTPMPGLGNVTVNEYAKFGPNIPCG